MMTEPRRQPVMRCAPTILSVISESCSDLLKACPHTILPIRTERKLSTMAYFETLVTDELRSRLAALPSASVAHVQNLRADEAAASLTQEVARQLAKILDDLEGSGEEKLMRQVDLLNEVIVAVRHAGRSSGLLEPFAKPPEVLHAITAPAVRLWRRRRAS